MSENNKPPTTPAGWAIATTYIASGGKCPKCGHEANHAAPVARKGHPGMLFSDSNCMVCDAEWVELYRLAGYDPKAGAA